MGLSQSELCACTGSVGKDSSPIAVGLIMSGLMALIGELLILLEAGELDDCLQPAAHEIPHTYKFVAGGPFVISSTSTSPLCHWVPFWKSLT
jgi:hypothetical protein